MATSERSKRAVEKTFLSIFFFIREKRYIFVALYRYAAHKKNESTQGRDRFTTVHVYGIIYRKPFAILYGKQ